VSRTSGVPTDGCRPPRSPRPSSTGAGQPSLAHTRENASGESAAPSSAWKIGWTESIGYTPVFPAAPAYFRAGGGTTTSRGVPFR
jgi:hypothetical protein